MGPKQRVVKRARELNNNNSEHFSRDGLSKQRKPIFEYPELPKWESRLYFVVLSSFLAYGWRAVYKISQEYKWPDSADNVTSHIPFFGLRRKDTSNYEWDMYIRFLPNIVTALIGHSIVFNLSYSIIGLKRRFLFEIITLSYALVSNSLVFCSWKIVGLSIAQGLSLFCVARFFKSSAAIWIFAVPILWVNSDKTLSELIVGELTELNEFEIMTFSNYKVLNYIGFCLEMVRGNVSPEIQGFRTGLWRMMNYAFYTPYAICMIMLYPDFEKQLVEKQTKARDWKVAVFFGARMVFWFLFLEFSLHFLYFEAILDDFPVIYRANKATLVSLGYAIGQFFHLKYVIIFGLPALFAHIDNLEPHPEPICITRVQLYSKMWREFDRGLYKFFKAYIFIPICEPTFSPVRKLFGIFISYAFVLLWHSLQHNIVVWVALNVFELLMEVAAKWFYVGSGLKEWREKHISDLNFRRILAWLQIIPFAFALFGTFYFLTGSLAGYTFVHRIFWQEAFPLKWPFWLLVLEGYFYCHCCMDAEIMRNKHRKMVKQA